MNNSHPPPRRHWALWVTAAVVSVGCGSTALDDFDELRRRDDPVVSERCDLLWSTCDPRPACAETGTCCAEDETCFRAPRIFGACRRHCVPTSSSGRCAGRDVQVLNPLSAEFPEEPTIGCLPDGGCRAFDATPCGQGAAATCAPVGAWSLCALAGEQPLGGRCAPALVDAHVDQGCIHPLVCLPDRVAASLGTCRRGCDPRRGDADCASGQRCCNFSIRFGPGPFVDFGVHFLCAAPEECDS